MLAYNTEKFTSLYFSGIGVSICAFLRRPESAVPLEAASELSKPTAEVIAERILEEFRDKVLADCDDADGLAYGAAKSGKTQLETRSE